MSQIAGWVLAVDRPFKVVFTLSFTSVSSMDHVLLDYPRALL